MGLHVLRERTFCSDFTLTDNYSRENSLSVMWTNNTKCVLPYLKESEREKESGRERLKENTSQQGGISSLASGWIDYCNTAGGAKVDPEFLYPIDFIGFIFTIKRARNAKGDKKAG